MAVDKDMGQRDLCRKVSLENCKKGGRGLSTLVHWEKSGCSLMDLGGWSSSLQNEKERTVGSVISKQRL
jgi:hypothetical protein